MIKKLLCFFCILMLLTITVFAKEDSIGSTLLERISYIQQCAGPMPLLLTISLVILYILAEICFIIYKKKFKNIKNDLKENKTSDYLPVVYGVRAISLILIVMFHIWEQTWIFYNLKISETKYLFNLEVFQRHGYVAIDIYFLLSGFCLFYPIARNMFGEIKFTGWKDFFIKRVRRIYPVYVFLLIIAIIFPALSINYSANNGLLYTTKHFFSHILFLNNFSSETLSSIIGTAWFLPVIVQFYIVFPLICKFFRKKPILTFSGMTVVAVLVRLTLLCNFDLGSQMSQAFMPEYLDVLGFGMLSAYFVVYAKHKIKHIYEMKFYMTLMSMVCVLAAIGYFFWISNMHMPDGIYGGNMYFRTLYRGIFAMIVAIFMFTTCFSYDFWNKKIWGNKFFVFLSSISYAMFLCHQNICLFLKKINIPYTTANPVMDDRPAMEGLTLLCLIISIATSVILTKYVEQPICKYGYKGYFKNIKNRLFSFVCHNRDMNQKNKKISNYLLICGCIILSLSFIWNFTQQYPWSTNNFNSYILQAQSWLQGKLDVNNIEYLELAIFNNKYFVSFPPFPSYIMLPFVAMGWNNCDGFITVFFTLVGAIYAYKLACCFRESNIICIFWTLFLVIGSNTLFTAITPYVWFIAQNMCFSLLIISLYYAKKGNGKLSLIAWACAVGCRPLSLFYIFLITYLLYKNLKLKNPEKNIKNIIISQWKWYIVPSIIALSYMLLNLARFGNPIEFGHNYLPEFTSSEHGQFSIHYILNNIKSLFRFPLTTENGHLKFLTYDGFCMFIASPLFLIYVIYIIQFFIKKEKENRYEIIIASIILIIELLCITSHKTMGGYHIGNRYTNDVLPLALFSILSYKSANKQNALIIIPLFFVGIILNTIWCLIYYKAG